MSQRQAWWPRESRSHAYCERCDCVQPVGDDEHWLLRAHEGGPRGQRTLGRQANRAKVSLILPVLGVVRLTNLGSRLYDTGADGQAFVAHHREIVHVFGLAWC